VFNKYPGTVYSNTIVGIASASDVQAKKLLYEMRKLLRLGNQHMKLTYRDKDNNPMFGEEFFTDLLDDHEPNNTTTLTFKPHDKAVHGEYLLAGSKSGSVIKSYPPTSGVLGETFTVVVIDEAGKSDKITDQFFYDFMYPTGNSTNAIRIYLSTPWTTSGFFYRLVDPDDIYPESAANVVVFTVDAIKIENPEYHKVVMKTIKALEQDGKIDEVQRAYYCRFVKGDDNYFNPDKVLDSFTSDYSMYNSYNGMTDMGVDFGGQAKSKTVITISELTNEGHIRRLYHKSYAVGQDLSLIDDMQVLIKQFNVQRIIPDECPAGDFLIRTMKEKGWNIHPMSFKADKVKKYGAFRSHLNRGEVVSYKDDALQTEMLAMETIQGDRTTKIRAAAGYNDDLIDSFIMSCYFYVSEDTGFKVFNLNSIKRTKRFDKDKERQCPACESQRIMFDEERRICKECKYEWHI